MLKQTAVVVAVCVALTGCTVNAPVDPADAFGSLGAVLNNARRDVENVIEDPLNNRPYPVILGGDSERIFYATNLGDIRIRFPGPSGRVVIPGLLGPSNLYEHRDGKRELIRPLLPAGSFSGLTTDGGTLAYLAWTLDASAADTPVGVALIVNDRTVFEAAPSELFVQPPLFVVDGTVAYLVHDLARNVDELRRYDVAAGTSTTVVEAAAIYTFVARGDRIAYLAATVTDAAPSVIVHQLSSGIEHIIATAEIGANIVLSDNHVVWSDPGSDGVSRVSAFNVATDEFRVWADAVAGTLTGATDSAFLTEEEFIPAGNAFADRVVIRLFEVGGRERELARFRAQGLAGQSFVLGDRVVFVNDARRIVVVPLNGGERINFLPF